MVLCKIQMALSTSADQLDAVSRCLLYLFVGCLRLECLLCSLSMLSHSTFKGNLKECVMKTVSNGGGLPPFQGLKCLAVVLQKQAFLNSSFCKHARLWPELWEASFYCGDWPQLHHSQLLSCSDQKNRKSYGLCCLLLIKFNCNPPHPSPSFWVWQVS